MLTQTKYQFRSIKHESLEILYSYDSSIFSHTVTFTADDHVIKITLKDLVNTLQMMRKHPEKLDTYSAVSGHPLVYMSHFDEVFSIVTSADSSNYIHVDMRSLVDATCYIAKSLGGSLD